MNKIEKTFTYKIADDYLAQTMDLGKTGEWTYTGPDKIWILIDKESNKYAGRFITEDEDGEHYPTPLDKYKILIDCDQEPLIATLVGAGDLVNYDEKEQYYEELPCGGTYKRLLNPAPDHTYEFKDFEYNLELNEFKTPYPLKQPHITWEQLRLARNAALAASDHKVGEFIPTSVSTEWEEYRQQLRDFPQLHGASNSSEVPSIDPWKTLPVCPPDEAPRPTV